MALEKTATPAGDMKQESTPTILGKEDANLSTPLPPKLNAWVAI